MPDTPKVIRATRRGINGWLEIPTGRFVPAIAGAEEPTPEEIAAQQAADKATAEKAAAEKAAANAAAEDEKLGDAGKAALEAERKARRDAEKRAKAAEDKAREYEDAEKSELEKAQDRIKHLEANGQQATEKVRRANLLAELSKSQHGLASAKAALKLIDGVEYDDDGEPLNATERIEALLTENPFLKAAANGTSTTSPASPQRDRGGEMTREQIADLAKTNPKLFNEKFDKGEIALGG
jgi:hypothetical protein